jgi:hypothetical protein
LIPLGRGVITNALSERSIVVNSKSTTCPFLTYRVIPSMRLFAAAL